MKLTLIVEIEGILNCRPITYVYNDEFSKPLTSSHLIYEYRILSTKSINDQNETMKMNNLVLVIYQNIKYLLKLLESHWNQWTKEHHTTGKNVNSIIKLGDIVFIHNHNAKRNV